MTPTRSQNFYAIDTINGSSVAGSAISVLGNNLSIAGLTESIPLNRITKYSRTVYAAGTKAKKTVTPGATILDNTEYQVSVTRLGDPTSKKTYIIFTGIGETVTTFNDKARAAILADLQAYVVGTGTTTLILEMTDTASDLLVDVSAYSSGSTVAVTTAYVEPSGTFAIVNALDPVNAVATGNYITYQITYKRDQRSSVVDGAFVSNERTVIVFADGAVANVTAAKKAEFDSKLVSVLTSLSGRAGFAPTILTTNATYNAVLADNFIVYNYAGANTINLPDSASYGDGMLVIANPSGSTVTVGKTTGGDTLIGTSSTTILTVQTAIYMNCAAITTWSRVSIS